MPNRLQLAGSGNPCMPPGPVGRPVRLIHQRVWTTIQRQRDHRALAQYTDTLHAIGGRASLRLTVSGRRFQRLHHARHRHHFFSCLHRRRRFPRSTRPIVSTGSAPSTGSGRSSIQVWPANIEQLLRRSWRARHQPSTFTPPGATTSTSSAIARVGARRVPRFPGAQLAEHAKHLAFAKRPASSRSPHARSIDASEADVGVVGSQQGGSWQLGIPDVIGRALNTAHQYGWRRPDRMTAIDLCRPAGPIFVKPTYGSNGRPGSLIQRVKQVVRWIKASASRLRRRSRRWSPPASARQLRCARHPFHSGKVRGHADRASASPRDRTRRDGEPVCMPPGTCAPSSAVARRPALVEAGRPSAASTIWQAAGATHWSGSSTWTISAPCFLEDGDASRRAPRRPPRRDRRRRRRWARRSSGP